MKIQRFQVLVLLTVILLGLTLITWSLYHPSKYGAANTPLEAGEVEVIWFNAPTMNGDIQRITYTSEGPIEIYIVTQASYNLSTREIPDSYLYYHHDNSSTLTLNGPLPVLYYILISEINQYVNIQSWVFSPAAQISEVLIVPLAILAVATAIITAGWYLQSKKSRP